MIAKLQNTDKLLLEHAYAQTRLYSTQLYTEAGLFKSFFNAIKDTKAGKAVAAGAKETYTNTKAVVAKIAGITGQTFLAALSLRLDFMGNSMGEFNVDTGATGFAVNYANSAAIAIFLASSIYYARKGQYLKSLMWIAVMLAITGDTELTSMLQGSIFAAGGGVMLIGKAFDIIENLINKADKAIYTTFIKRAKNLLEKGISKCPIIPGFLKKLLLKTLNGILKDPAPPAPDVPAPPPAPVPAPPPAPVIQAPLPPQAPQGTFGSQYGSQYKIKT